MTSRDLFRFRLFDGAQTELGLLPLEATTQGYTLSATTATYTLTGNATTFQAARKLSAATQTYTLTGTATGLRAGRKVVAATATYTLTGITTPLQVARKLPVTTGTFTLTGVAAGLSRAYPFVVSTGSFTLSGIDTVLRAARKIAATTATYTLTGTNSGVAAQRNLAGGIGVLSLTGIDADLTYTPAAGAYTMDAEPGVFTLTGNDADFEYTSSEQPAGATHYPHRDKYPRWVVIGDKAHYVRSAVEENYLTAEFDQQESQKQPARGKRKKPKELPFSAIALGSLPEIESANEGFKGSTPLIAEGANRSTLPTKSMNFMADTQAIIAQMQADELEEEEMIILAMAA